MNTLKRAIGPTAAKLAMLAATVASPAAWGAVVCATTSVAIPANINGIYVNFVTNATGTSGSATSGWDFSAYSPSSGLLTFYLSANTAAVGTGTVANALAGGTPIGPTSTFTNTSTSSSTIVTPTAFRAGGTQFAGLRFTNEATGVANYGWAELTTVGPNGFPATINRYCYENAGAAITAGTTPVALQAYSVD